MNRYYCGSQGLAEPTGTCDAGWYCTGGAELAQPSDGAQGGQCQPGHFCPAGSAAMVPCSAGQYCADYELAEPNDNCSAGYVCFGGAITPTPTDGTTGENSWKIIHLW